jgi:hypothetical protein
MRYNAGFGHRIAFLLYVAKQVTMCLVQRVEGFGALDWWFQ